ERLGNHALDVGGIGFHGGGQRIAAERAEANAAVHDLFARLYRQPLVIAHEELSVAQDGRALGSEVERYHVELLAQDVAPYVALGPVREREHAHRLAGAEPAVQETPHL